MDPAQLDVVASPYTLTYMTTYYGVAATRTKTVVTYQQNRIMNIRWELSYKQERYMVLHNNICGRTCLSGARANETLGRYVRGAIFTAVKKNTLDTTRRKSGPPVKEKYSNSNISHGYCHVYPHCEGCWVVSIGLSESSCVDTGMQCVNTSPRHSLPTTTTCWKIPATKYGLRSKYQLQEIVRYPRVSIISL